MLEGIEWVPLDSHSGLLLERPFQEDAILKAIQGIGSLKSPGSPMKFECPILKV